MDIKKNNDLPIAKYPQTGGFCFVARKVKIEKQFFVLSSSGNSIPT